MLYLISFLLKVYLLKVGKIIVILKKNMANYNSFIHRIGNAVAHNLAKHARHVIGFKVWMKDVLPPLHSILLANYG